MTVGRMFTKIYILISLSRAFFENRKLRVSHRVKMMTRWPCDPDVKDDPNDTHLPGEWWPNDPVPCLVASTQPVQVPVPVLESQVPVWVPLLEIDITFLFKAAKVEVSKALLLKPDWIIIDKRSKPAHCYSSLHIRTVVTFNNNQFWEQCVWQSCTVWLQDDATLTEYTLCWSIWSWHT